MGLHISALGQFMLVLLELFADASLLKHAIPASFRITLSAAGVAPDFISPSSSFVCFSLVGQISGAVQGGNTKLQRLGR